MVWGRIDDSFWDHPKVLEAGNEAVGVWVRWMAYCNRQLTDGLIPAGVLAMGDPTGELRDRLVSVGLLDANNDGFWIHDFLDFNKSRAEVLAEREAAALRQKRARCKKSGHAPPDCDCPGESRRSYSVTNGVTSAAPTRPDPTRPDIVVVGGAVSVADLEKKPFGGWPGWQGMTPAQKRWLDDLAPFDPGEVDWARAEVEAAGGKPNFGLFVSKIKGDRKRKAPRAAGTGPPGRSPFRESTEKLLAMGAPDGLDPVRTAHDAVAGLLPAKGER